MEKNNKKNTDENKKTLDKTFFSPEKLTVIIISFGLLFVIALSFFVYYREIANTKMVLLASEKASTHAMSEHIHNIMQTLSSDLRIVASHTNLRNYFETGDEYVLNGLGYDYLQMSASKKIYDQIRFLDSTGMEVLRVNYNSGNPYVVESADLQNKKGRYYFDATFELGPEKIFVSPFDLNIEQDKIEQPLKPVLRLGMPVIDRNGNKQGIVLFNYLGNHLLESMDNFYQAENGTLLFVNQDGYWIKGFSPKDEWGFMYEDKSDRTVQNSYPELWEEMKINEYGNFETKEGFFTYRRIYPLENVQKNDKPQEKESVNLDNEEYAWVIISFVPKEQLTATLNSFLVRILVIDSLLFLVIFFLIWRLSISLKQRKRAEKTILELNDLLRIINKMLRHDVLGKIGAVRASLEASDLIKKNNMITNAYNASLDGITLVKNMRELEKSFAVDKPMEKYDLRPLIKTIAKNQEMKIKITGDGVVMADAAINSVFENIIRNAKIHAGVDSLIVVIQKEKNKTVVRIADKGAGIEKDIRDSLFEEGVKSSTTGNTGIGLYVTKKTIDRYGGSIYAEDNKPKGTVFVVEFPNKK